MLYRGRSFLERKPFAPSGKGARKRSGYRIKCLPGSLQTGAFDTTVIMRELVRDVGERVIRLGGH